MSAFKPETLSHRLTVHSVRKKILARPASKSSEADLETLDSAFQAHITANTDFALVNSDATMISLIGTWARMTKVIRDLEDKYA